MSPSKLEMLKSKGMVMKEKASKAASEYSKNGECKVF